MIGRRTLLAAFAAAAAALAAPAHAGALKLVRGEVTAATWPGFSALLFETLENPVMLDVTIPVDHDESDGHLSTFVLDGQLELAFHAGPKGSNVYADTGFELVDDGFYTLKGTFVVKPASVHSGIPWLMLEETEPAAGGYLDVAVDTLRAPD